MHLARLVEFQDAFDEPKLDWPDYLTGIGNDALLAAATHFLGRQDTGPTDYHNDMVQLFGPHNETAAKQVFRRLEEVERREGSKLKVVHPKSALRLFEYAFQRPDEPHTQSEAAVELSLFKAFVAQNDEYSAEQNAAIEAAQQEQGLHKLAALALAGAHSDFELVNFDTHRVLLMQLLKSVKLFQFLEPHLQYQPLLTAFLQHYNCSTWQDYMRQLVGIVMAIVHAEKAGRTEIHVVRDSDFEENCAFFDKLILPAGAQLDGHDFLTTRERPLYKQSEGVYVVVFPVFVAEMLHKGLFFQLDKLNKSTKPKILKGIDWRGAYCSSFSEDYLLSNLLDSIFLKRGLAWSGQRIKAGEWLKNIGEAEPDYYFRSGKRVLLFESKDVNIKKQAKAGEDFASFLVELRKKFYHGVKDDGSRDDDHEVGVLQLIHNIRRLLSEEKELGFDTAYNPASLIIYPVLVVHDRLYNMPGLNELVDGWFQQELAKLGEQAVRQVHPLVIIDVDTLLAYQEHFASKNLVLWDVIEAYQRYIKPVNRKARSEQEAHRLIIRGVHPFAHFLDDYAAKKNLVPVPKRQFPHLLKALELPAEKA